MTGIRLLLVLVAIAALAAAGWFYMKGRGELEHSEKVMSDRWAIWVNKGAVNDAKLAELRADPKWASYSPKTTGVTATPFHDEFGYYLDRNRVMTMRAAMALGGVGLVVLILALAIRPTVVVPATTTGVT